MRFDYDCPMVSSFTIAWNFGENWTIERVRIAEREAWSLPDGQPLYQAHLYSQYLEQSRSILEHLDVDDLAKLPLDSRRSLAAASLLLWQQRLGATNADYADNNLAMAACIAAYIAAHGQEGLIADLKLASKAQSTLARSPLYQSLIETGADRVVDYVITALSAGIDDEATYHAAIIDVQANLWREVLPDDFGDLGSFTVVTDEYYPADSMIALDDGTYGTYIGPDTYGKPHWLAGNHRQQSWLISHEYLHYLQMHRSIKYSNGTLKSDDLAHDVYAESFLWPSNYNIPLFPESIFGSENRLSPTYPLWRAAHEALYLSLGQESAAFALHDRIIARLNARLGPVPIPPQTPGSNIRPAPAL